MEYQRTSSSESETKQFGTRLSPLIRPGDVIAFFGELGSGKTCLIKGLCRGLKVQEDVTSPTFTLINEYTGTYPIYHFDFYRIESEDEMYGLGYEEYFYNQGVCLIEWADRIAQFLPKDRIEIHLKSFYELGQENIRQIDIRMMGELFTKRDWSLLIKMGRSDEDIGN